MFVLFDTSLGERKKNRDEQEKDGGDGNAAGQLVFYLKNLRHKWDTIPTDSTPFHCTMNDESMCAESLSTTW